MSIVKARGQLRHRFWAEYSAAIVLAFDSPEAARDVLPVLGAGWKKHDKEPKALCWVGNSAELEECTKVLVSFGAEDKKIASLEKSIDFGEPFEITVPIECKEQASLF